MHVKNLSSLSVLHNHFYSVNCEHSYSAINCKTHTQQTVRSVSTYLMQVLSDEKHLFPLILEYIKEKLKQPRTSHTPSIM